MLPYQNPKLTPEKRTKDLLARMTLEEKAAQMTCVWQTKNTTLLDDKGRFNEPLAKKSFKKRLGIGQVGRPSDAGGGTTPTQNAELTNAIQKFFLENSRLGIPVLFHEECLHGHMAPHATSFPQPIGLAGTFNPELIEALYAMTALEARSRGTHHALTPVVDVARDPRWGRVEETYGEDTYLVSRMGVAAVKGFQGDASFKDKTRVIATLKHFVAHGAPESGMNCAPANVSMRVLREVFLPPFKACVQEAGALSIMPSYNEVDALPSHANPWLLRDVLRKEWGFDGLVVSDYYAVQELNNRPETHGHFLAPDHREACRLAVKAGVNIELPEPDCYLHLVDLVKSKELKESELDALVAPVLLWKFKMGLFDDPFVNPADAEKIVAAPAHLALARQAATETITLLKNDNNVAPINLDKIKTIAVIGPNADRVLFGGYSSTPKYNVTVLQGIKEKVGSRAKVLYSEGCRITKADPTPPLPEVVHQSDPVQDRKQIAEALKVAQSADVIILAIGGNEQTAREAYSLARMGDRASLELLGRQNELVEAMASTGKPIIALLFNGRPLALEHLASHVPTIFECWYLGQECGHAVADILFGDANPGGKLPISFPRSAGHLPVYYNHKPSDRRGYLFDDCTALYPFGHGLSYTSFSLDKPTLKKAKIKPTDSTSISVKVTNTGKLAGHQTIQLYIRDLVSSVTRPVKELRAFKKIFLEPGASEVVTLPITPASLAFYDVNMKYLVEPGQFELQIGTSSRDTDLQKLTLTVTK